MNEFITAILEDRKPLVDITLALNLTVAGDCRPPVGPEGRRAAEDSAVRLIPQMKMRKGTMSFDGREIRLQRLMGDGRAVSHRHRSRPVRRADSRHGRPAGHGGEDQPGGGRRLAGPRHAPALQQVFARPKRPLAVVRLNWNTVYCFKLGYTKAPRASSATIRAEALREGMDIALVSLTLQTGDEERDAANVEVFSR